MGSLDPAKAVGEHTLMILRTLCDGLTTVDPSSGVVVPSIASSWLFDDGGRRLSVTIRDGLKFKDGTKVDAPAVRDSLLRVQQPEVASPWATLLEGVEGIQAKGRSRVVFKFKTSSYDFDSVLSHPGLIPVSRVASTDPKAPACSGPLVDVEFRSSDSVEKAYELFTAGQVDIAPVPASRIKQSRGKPGYEFAATPSITYLAFDTSKSPTDNLRLRHAVSLALGRLVLIDAAYGDQKPPAIRWLDIESPTSCSSWAGVTADEVKAKETLDPALPSGLALPLTFDEGPDEGPDEGRPEGRIVAVGIQAQLKAALGIEFLPRPMDTPTFETTVIQRPEVSAWLLTHHPVLPTQKEVLGSLFRTGSHDNRLGFSDPAIDALIDARQWQAVEDAVCSVMPAIPLWRGVNHWVADPSKLRWSKGHLLDIFGLPILRQVERR